MGAHWQKCVYKILIVVAFCIIDTYQGLAATSSPVFQFQKEIESICTYIALPDEKLVLSCLHHQGGTVNIDVHTPSDNQPRTIVNNSTVDEIYEDSYKLEYTGNSTDITLFSPEISGSVFICTNRQTYITSSLKVVYVPLQNTSANDSNLSFITCCSVDMEFERSYFSNISSLASKKVINDTHCEISLKVECNVDEPYSLMYSIHLANEPDVETRHFSVTVCSQLGSTTEIMTTGPSTSPQQSTLLTATPSQGKGQESPASWIVSVVPTVVGFAAFALIVFVVGLWMCKMWN